MYIYLDESGCTGLKLDAGSSAFFTLTAVVLPSQEAARAARAVIQRHRAEIGWHPGNEFKFNKTSVPHKRRFFEMARTIDFSFHSFTLNKRSLTPNALRDGKRLYHKVTEWTLGNVLDGLAGQPSPRRISVVFDACGEREFYRSLQRLIRDMAQRKLGAPISFTVTAEDSHRDDLLQLADMVCGAVAKSENGTPIGRELLSAIAEKRRSCRFWPP